MVMLMATAVLSSDDVNDVHVIAVLIVRVEEY